MVGEEVGRFLVVHQFPPPPQYTKESLNKFREIFVQIPSSVIIVPSPPCINYALAPWRPGERLAVVMDSEYVFKGIMEWSPKWRRHGWRTASGEVGHKDLWETILWERERAGDELQIHWIPSHLGVQGNDEADAHGRSRAPGPSRQ